VSLTSFVAQDPAAEDHTFEVVLLKPSDTQWSELGLEWLQTNALFVGLIASYAFATDGVAIENLTLSLVQEIPTTISSGLAVQMWSANMKELDGFTSAGFKRLLVDEALEEMRTPEKKRKCANLEGLSSPNTV